MELDEFKRLWQESQTKPTTGLQDIAQILKRKSHHPLMTLQKRFRRGMVIVPLAFALVTNVFSRHHTLISDPMYWAYTLFSVATLIYFIISYRLANKMTHPETDVKHHVQEQFNKLSRIFRWRRVGTRVTLLVMIILLETLFLLDKEPGLRSWHDKPVMLRLGVYASVVALFFVGTHFSFKYRYERHFAQLKKLIGQFEEGKGLD